MSQDTNEEKKDLIGLDNLIQEDVPGLPWWSVVKNPPANVGT